MNKNYPIYKTTFIDDIRSLVEEAAQNFANDTAISYKDKPSDKEVKKVTFAQWRDDVRHLGTALIAHGLREENIAIVGENSYGWGCAFFAVMGTGSVTVPVDKELPIEDIDGIITTTGCKAVIYGRTAEGKVKELLAKGGLASAKLLVAIDPAPAIDKALLGDKTLTYVDMLNDKPVLGEDGFYHLDDANGPLVLMYLGEDVQYLDCFKTILDHTGVNRYFFDENGEFIRKEDYVDCLGKYIECMDEDKGVYPLTEDLKYILQMEGEDSGWFDTDNSLYLFKDDNGNYVDGINNEISWLFMCCYIAK